VLTVLFNRDGAVLSDNKLRAILKGFESSGNSPQACLKFTLRFHDFTPHFELNYSGGISADGVVKESTLLGAPRFDGINEHH